MLEWGSESFERFVETEVKGKEVEVVDGVRAVVLVHVEQVGSSESFLCPLTLSRSISSCASLFSFTSFRLPFMSQNLHF